MHRARRRYRKTGLTHPERQNRASPNSDSDSDLRGPAQSTGPCRSRRNPISRKSTCGSHRNPVPPKTVTSQTRPPRQARPTKVSSKLAKGSGVRNHSTRIGAKKIARQLLCLINCTDEKRRKKKTHNSLFNDKKLVNFFI